MSWIDKTTILLRAGEQTGSVAARDEAIVDDLIPTVEGLIAKLLGYDVLRAEHTEYLPDKDELPDRDPITQNWDSLGNKLVPVTLAARRGTVTLTHRPVREIITVHENPGAWSAGSGTPDFSSTYLLTAGTHYNPDWQSPDFCPSGVLYRISGGWCQRRRCIKAVYEAGYEAGELVSSGIGSVLHNSGVVSVLANLFKHRAWRGRMRPGQDKKGLDKDLINGDMPKVTLPDCVVDDLSDRVSVAKFLG